MPTIFRYETTNPVGTTLWSLGVPNAGLFILPKACSHVIVRHLSGNTVGVAFSKAGSPIDQNLVRVVIGSAATVYPLERQMEFDEAVDIICCEALSGGPCQIEIIAWR